MGGQTQLVGNDNAPNDQRSVGGESMGIVAEAYAKIRHIVHIWVISNGPAA